MFMMCYTYYTFDLTFHCQFDSRYFPMCIQSNWPININYHLLHALSMEATTVYRECFACVNCLRFAIILSQRKDLTRIVLPLQSFRARAWRLQRMNRY